MSSRAKSAISFGRGGNWESRSAQDSSLMRKGGEIAKRKGNDFRLQSPSGRRHERGQLM